MRGVDAGRIVLAEDDPALRDLLARRLTSEGYDVRLLDGPRLAECDDLDACTGVETCVGMILMITRSAVGSLECGSLPLKRRNIFRLSVPSGSSLICA